MGGNAFHQIVDGQEPVRISQLSISDYHALRQHSLTALQPHFARCICPTEAPERLDHGDVDVLVAKPVAQYCTADMASWLGATSYRRQGELCNFAVSLNSQDYEDKAHGQVDVRICAGNIDWLAFMQSYGDVWLILGTVIRQYGLTATDTGFHARIEEVEKRDWKGSRVFLSNDPEAVMQFLGLDPEHYEQGFDSEQCLFQWLLTCSLLDPSNFDHEIKTADDRRRHARPMYARFMAWVATQADTVTHVKVQQSRQSTLVNALRWFGKEDIFQEKLRSVQQDMLEEKARVQIVGLLRSHGLKQDKANFVVRALKRWTHIQAQRLVYLDVAQMVQDMQLCLGDLLDESRDVLRPRYVTWILENCQDIQRLERNHLKSTRAARCA